MSQRQVSPFGQRLRQARLRQGLTQGELGILAGIDEFGASAKVCQYEKGSSQSAGFPRLLALARVLRVPTAYFWACEDELAELLYLYGKLTPEQKAGICSYSKEISRHSTVVEDKARVTQEA
jgi:transcriptional regulator with XRE-family HTH domain